MTSKHQECRCSEEVLRPSLLLSVYVRVCEYMFCVCVCVCYLSQIASCLWDLARLSAYERETVSGKELPHAFIDSWVANFTLLVQGVRTAMPHVSAHAIHVQRIRWLLPKHSCHEKCNDACMRMFVV
jgi:hypothetical protein